MGRYGYGYGYAPCRTPAVIWSADFSALPLSTTANASELRAALAAMGLTLTRASAATVQTSASEVVTSGIGVDDPRVGRYGLVIEESRQCINPRSTAVTTAPWGKVQGTETFASDDATAPDGSVDGDRILTTTTTDSGTFYNYTSFTTQSYAFSTWAKSRTGSAQNYRFRMPNICGTSNQYSSAASAGTAWSRGSYVAAVTVGTGNSSALIVNPAGVAIDVNAWGAQLEAGKFPTELILTTGAAATRAGDRLQLSQRVLATVVRGGRLCMEFDFVPKAATRAGYASAPIFFAHDSGNYAGFGNTIGAMQACVAGVAVNLSPSGIDWTAGQRVRVFIEIGAGTPKAWVKIDEAAAVYATHATVHAAFPTISALDVMNYLGILQFSAWIRRIRAWAPGRRPAWAV